MTTPAKTRTPLLSGRALIAVAVLGAVAAVAYAFGPVRQRVDSYRYRPAATPTIDGAFPDPSVASLALARSVPDELRVVLPCEVAVPASSFSSMRLELWSSLDGATRSAVSFPDLGDALRITVSQGAVIVTVGSEEILRAFADPAPGCVAVIGYHDGQWTADAGGEGIVASGPGPTLAEAAFAGPATSSPATEVVVATRELGSSPSSLQWFMLTVALVSLGLAMREIAVRGSSVAKPGASRGSAGAWLRQAVNAPDLVVLGVLATWTLLIPLNIDDGWIAARVGSYPAHGDIAGIFTAHSAPMPLGYWLEWLQHLWLLVGSTPLVMRIPALLISIATWVGLRSVGRTLGVRVQGAAVWVMAAAFLAGFGAWGVTLRVESVLALLLVVSVRLGIRFDRGARGRVLVWWIVVIALAMAAHPAGIIVVAPLVVSWRSVWAWARESREERAVAIACLVTLGALIAVLFFFDSNVTTKSASVEAYRSDAQGLSILDEPTRYGLLDVTPYATPLRRASAALIFVAMGFFLLGGRIRERSLRIPAWSILVAVVLLTLTPSKWPSHLGGLLGLAALVLALGLRRLSRMRAVLAMAGLVAAMAWSWSESAGWAVFDLRTAGWPGAARSVLTDLSSPLLWIVVASIVGGAVFAFGGWAAKWTPHETFAVVAVGVVILLTGSTLVGDTVRTDGWTFGRQNLRTVIGAAGCGLGDEVRIPSPGSLHALSTAPDSESTQADRSAAEAGFAGDGLFLPGGYPDGGLNGRLPVPGLGIHGSWVESTDAAPDANVGSFRSEWFVLDSPDTTVGLMVVGSYDGGSSANGVGVQWGAAAGSGVTPLGVAEPELHGYFLDWKLVEFASPPAADRVRALVRDGTTGGGDAWVAASDPVGLSTTTIGEIATRVDRPQILVSPTVSPYFPCVPAPRLDGTVAPVPGVIVQTWPALWETTFAAAALSDRYFNVAIDLEPPFAPEKIGAHSGDTGSFVFVSQEYLIGRSARVTGFFERLPSG